MAHFQEDVTQDDKQLIVDQIQSQKKIYYLVLIMLGLLNNFGYVLINSSAQQLAEEFNESSLMPFFTTSLTLLGICTSFVNSKYLLKIKHLNKIRAMVVLCSISYLCVGLSHLIQSKFGFFLSLFGSVIMGISGTLGEQTILGFLKGFAPELIAGWASGTGFAGVFGAGVNFLLRSVQVPGSIIFLAMIPTTFIYLGGFTWLNNQKVLMIERQEDYHGLSSRENLSEAPQEKESQEAQINQTLSIENFKRLWPQIRNIALNLAVVYFLEYTIIIGFADKATHQFRDSAKPIEKYSFILLNFCYQVGVVISRSSLPIIKIPKVWIVSALQLLNFVIWAWIAYTKELSLPFEFVIMIWVGLMGGASYVNCLYLILESEEIEKKDKEVSINIMSICNNIGVLSATLASFVLGETVYKDK